MDAGKATISGVFNGSRLLEIPFYQRAYVWGEEQWERFLGDMEFVTASKRPYFLGSIILKQASSGNTWSEVSEVRTVIDGQQRLTTMVIFFKALCAQLPPLAVAPTRKPARSSLSVQYSSWKPSITADSLL